MSPRLRPCGLPRTRGRQSVCVPAPRPAAAPALLVCGLAGRACGRMYAWRGRAPHSERRHRCAHAAARGAPGVARALDPVIRSPHGSARGRAPRAASITSSRGAARAPRWPPSRLKRCAQPSAPVCMDSSPRRTAARLPPRRGAPIAGAAAKRRWLAPRIASRCARARNAAARPRNDCNESVLLRTPAAALGVPLPRSNIPFPEFDRAIHYCQHCLPD